LYVQLWSCYYFCSSLLPRWTYKIDEIQRYFGAAAPVKLTQSGVGVLGAAVSDLQTSESDLGVVNALVAPSMLLFLQRHVAQLSPASRQVLKYASCIGFEFSLLLLCQLLNDDQQVHYGASDVRAALQQPMKVSTSNVDMRTMQRTCSPLAFICAPLC
jgi:hypothetical protein